jgi:hypothetical protein
MAQKLTKTERARRARLRRERKLQARRIREIQDRVLVWPDGKARREGPGKSVFEDGEQP